MALTDDELIGISALTPGVNNNAGVIPNWIIPAEVQGNTGPVNSIPVQSQTIDIFSPLPLGGTIPANGWGWSANFQNPMQRVLVDIDIYPGDAAQKLAIPDLSALQITVSGFSKAVIFCAPKTSSDAPPANYLNLKVNGVTPAYKFGGRRRYLEQSGDVVIPLTMMLLSTTALTTGEVNRALLVTLNRINTSSGYIPVVNGRVYTNPLPSARDNALATA